MKYLIHATPKRMWYVENFLIPSMTEQGIEKQSIQVYNDKESDGNLKACMKAFLTCEGEGGTWHLQDDVVISYDFKEVTEKYRSGIVCGLCTKYDKNRRAGDGNVRSKWYSFPCIHIPNDIARRCGKWFFKEAIHDSQYWAWIEENKFDDSLFWEYVELHEENVKVFKVKPNIVNHIDYLLGGSIANKQRCADDLVKSIYWHDDIIVDNLEKELRAWQRKSRKDG